MLDFGGLDDVLDDDGGYVPSFTKKQSKTRLKPPTTMSRQNSTQSIGSLMGNKEQDKKISFGNNKAHNDIFSGLNKQSPKNSQFSVDKDSVRQPPKRNTLFGAHKETASIVQNSHNQAAERSFLDFFKNQNGPTTSNSAKPPLPDSKLLLPQKKNQLQSPESILDDEFNNSSMASRRGRPPLSRRNQAATNDSEIQQNRSENFTASHTPVLPTMLTVSKQQQPVQTQAKNTLMNDSIEELKKVFSNQLQYQKQGFETLMKQQRESHQQQTKNLREFHSEQMKKKLQIKQFELEKVKQFYELQLKIYSERQMEIKEYNTIAKKLQGNIETIQKLQKNFEGTEFRNRKEKQEEMKKMIERKEWQVKQKENELKELAAQLDKDRQQFRSEKLSLAQSIDAQKARLYELQVDLRKRQSQLQVKYKKLQARLVQQYETKAKQISKQKQQIRMEELNLREQRNIIEIEKLQVINSRKLWDSEKKAYLQQLHQQKTKVLQKQIQIASRTGQIEIKEQQVHMHQNDYINKLKLIELQKKKIQIQKNNTRGQFYLNATSGAFKTHGLLGTSLLNKTNTIALHKEFYSNDDYEREPLNEETNYKKSITQMRDEFLKGLPKF